MNDIIPLKNKTMVQVQRLRSKNGASINAHRQYQKKKADAQDPTDQQGWYQSMQVVFEEIDMAFKLLDPVTPQRFLDLGCCPGGFAAYILSRYPKTTGVGISLPVPSGGHEFLLEDYLQPRFEMLWGDFTRYQLGPALVQDPTLELLPPAVCSWFSDEGEEPTTSEFDIILVDGHPLRGLEDQTVTQKPWSPDRSQREHHRQPAEFYCMGDHILVSQLIIALQAVLGSIRGGAGMMNSGPTVVMKLSKPERLVTAQIMYMFDLVSAAVGTWKPVHMHATRSTFYLIARGVGCSPRFTSITGPISPISPHSPSSSDTQSTASEHNSPTISAHDMISYYLHYMQCLWHSLKYGGTGGTKRRLSETDMNFIVTKKELMGPYRARLEQLSEHVWEVESQSLKGWYRNEGF